MTQILIVDDDKVMVKLLKMQLGQKGFDTVSAYNGETAWDIISNPNTMPDIVILDVVMPGMSGVDLLHLIKDTNATKHIAVLMLTTENKIASLSESLNTGIIDYVIKPASLDQIMSRVLTVHRKLRKGVHELEKKELSVENYQQEAVIKKAPIKQEQESILHVDAEMEARKKISVLFIECFEANKHSLGKALSNLGYTVNTIIAEGQESTEEKTLETLSSSKYHIIIIDSAPNYLDGYKLTHLIREHGRANDVLHTVIGIGDDSKTEGKRWLIAGMNEYFQKPIPVKTVVESIKQFIARHGD